MFTSSCLMLALVAANAEGKPAPGQAAPGAPAVQPLQQVVPVKPGPAPIERPNFTLSVQKDAKLPAGPRPDATAAQGDGKLSVSIQPERKSFPANGPVAVTVTLKNVTEQPLRLYGVDQLGRAPKLVFVHLKTAGQTEILGTEAFPPNIVSTTLAPGATLSRTIVVEAPRFVIQPQPVPFPQPIPRPALPNARRAAELRDEAPKAAAPAIGPGVAPERRRPAFIAVPLPSITPEGTVRLKLFLEFTKPNDGAADANAAPHWSGRIASEAIDIEITAAVFNPQPGFPIGGPVTKEQAIAIAQQAAEGALNAAYQPVDGIRPPHEGAWIADPAKSADVKELANNAGWSVSWTHTPKGRGHSHHVKIDVSTAGQATVREVFAGYSAVGK